MRSHGRAVLAPELSRLLALAPPSVTTALAPPPPTPPPAGSSPPGDPSLPRRSVCRKKTTTPTDRSLH